MKLSEENKAKLNALYRLLKAQHAWNENKKRADEILKRNEPLSAFLKRTEGR